MIHIHIKLGDNKINKVKETKTLGVIVDDQLKWNSHINTVATKVSKGIGMIRRMKAFVPQSSGGATGWTGGDESTPFVTEANFLIRPNPVRKERGGTIVA